MAFVLGEIAAWGRGLKCSWGLALFGNGTQRLVKFKTKTRFGGRGTLLGLWTLTSVVLLLLLVFVSLSTLEVFKMVLEHLVFDLHNQLLLTFLPFQTSLLHLLIHQTLLCLLQQLTQPLVHSLQILHLFLHIPKVNTHLPLSQENTSQLGLLLLWDLV